MKWAFLSIYTEQIGQILRWNEQITLDLFTVIEYNENIHHPLANDKGKR